MWEWEHFGHNGEGRMRRRRNRTSNTNNALKKKDDISKNDLVKLIYFNKYVQISCPSQLAQ